MKENNPRKDAAHPVVRRLRLAPRWTLTLLTAAIILWLTLMPDDGSSTPPSWLAWLEWLKFPGADKVVHVLMFLGMAAVLLLDLAHPRRRTGATTLSLGIAAIFTSTLLGMVIECLQEWMAMGRSFDFYDLVADFLGSLLGALLMAWMLKYP